MLVVISIGLKQKRTIWLSVGAAAISVTVCILFLIRLWYKKKSRKRIAAKPQRALPALPMRLAIQPPMSTDNEDIYELPWELNTAGNLPNNDERNASDNLSDRSYITVLGDPVVMAEEDDDYIDYAGPDSLSDYTESQA